MRIRLHVRQDGVGLQWKVGFPGRFYIGTEWRDTAAQALADAQDVFNRMADIGARLREIALGVSS